MENTKLTREQLYQLVWSEPLSRLAKKYCISDNGLRKMCKSMDIPLPSNGYWMKIKYGKNVKKPQLPNLKSEKEVVTLYPRTENCNELGTKLSAQNKHVNILIQDTRLNLEVPDRLSSRPDPLITSTKNYRDALKRHDWRRGGRYPERIDVLNIDVSEESLPRAFRIMDTIIKALRTRGHEVKISEYKSYVIIDDESVAFRLREKNRVSEKKAEYGSREKIPTGDFMFCIGEYSWREKYVNDGKQRLESKIAVIIAKLEMEGKQRKEQRIESERRRKIWEEQERLAKELKERKETELKKFAGLFKEALMLEHARILRQYVEVKHDDKQFGDEWLEWVMKKIDWYDPIKKAKDDLLDDDYRDAIFKYFVELGKL